MRSNKLALGALFVLTSSTVQAQVATFDLTYSGGPFGNSAIATGSITIDEALVNNPGLNDQNGLYFPPPSPFVTAFSLTISGASAGNGTFTMSDYPSVNDPTANVATFYLFIGPGPVDFSQELVGQPDFLDFNVFNRAQFDFAPSGVNPFTISTNHGFSDLLILTSFRPAAPVPEPGSLVLLAGMSLCGAGFLARRRKNAHQAV